MTTLRTSSSIAVVVVALLALAAPTLAFIQERTPSGDFGVRWNLAAAQPNISAGRVVYVINKRGSDDVAFTDLTAAVDAAFATWRMANGSVIDFIRTTDPTPTTVPEGTTPDRFDNINVVFWDENPDNAAEIPSLTFAATLRQVDAVSGDIADADIVVNAFQFLWATKTDANFTSQTGPADVQAAITNAVGFFLGLNFVPTEGSVMQRVDYPGDTARRTLTTDELAAALEIYTPIPDPGVTSISGQITLAGQPVFGAYVAAYQNGQSVVGDISDAMGNYSIRRLPPIATSYTVRVLTITPPDRSFFSGLENNFLSEAYLDLATDPATSVAVTVGNDTPGINFSVSSADAADPWEPDDTVLTASPIAPNGPRQIHHTFPVADPDFVTFTATAGHLYIVETANLGMGVADSDTRLRVIRPSGPDLTNGDHNPKQMSRSSRIGFIADSGDHFVETVQEDNLIEGSGTAYDIFVQDLGAGPFSPPTVTNVLPPEGAEGGGFQVTITGSNFLPGASVTFGATPGTEVDVVSSNTLFATVPGTVIPAPDIELPVNVTVTNPDGTSSAPLVDGFTYLFKFEIGFQDDTAFALGIVPGNTTTISWIDYDADGALDVYFTDTFDATKVQSKLFRNIGGIGTFTDESIASGITVTGPQPFDSAAWGDFDNDGCIDAYLVNFLVSPENFLLRNDCDGTFSDVTAMAGVAGRANPNGRSRDAAWADYNNDGFLDLFVAYDDLNGPNQLFENNRNGTFTDVAATAGVDNVGLGLNANWGDFDNDGWPDLFLVRAGSQSDILYKNNLGTFTDVTAGAGIIDTADGTDALWADFNNDGFLDLYVMGATGINHLFQNNQSGGFTDISTTSGTGNTFGSAQAGAIADIDNDGLVDLFVAQAFDGRVDSQIDFLFHNDGGTPPTFSDATFDAGIADPFDGLSAAFGDYTFDGAPDLFVGNDGALTDVLFFNFADKNNWLIVRLVGTLSNRQGIGARVSVAVDLDGDGTPDLTQTKEMIGGSKGQSAIEAHFGLGLMPVERRKVSKLTVFWPTSGTMQDFLDLAPNQVITVFEGPQNLTVSSVSPNSGTVAGGTIVVVSGENFASDAVVTFGGLTATITPPVQSTSITVTTPAHGFGAVEVTVTNPSRPLGDPLRQGTLANGFLYFGDANESLFAFDKDNTTLIWGAVAGQLTYDAIRGNISSLSEGGGQVNLGSVICVENDSPDTTTAPNNVDQGVPALGQSFFYLVRFLGSYGSSSATSTRVPTSGDCP